MGYISRCFLIKMKAINPSIPTPASPLSQKLNFFFFFFSERLHWSVAFNPGSYLESLQENLRKNDTQAKCQNSYPNDFEINMTLILF